MPDTSNSTPNALNLLSFHLRNHALHDSSRLWCKIADDACKFRITYPNKALKSSSGVVTEPIP